MEDINNLCTKLIKTYNTDYLNHISLNKQELIYNLAQKYKNSKKPNSKNTLMKLIINRKLNKQPIYKYIAGPLSLSLQYNQEHNIIIYIFGEEHAQTEDCYKLALKKNNDIWDPKIIENYKTYTNNLHNISNNKCTDQEILNIKSKKCININTKLADKLITNYQEKELKNNKIWIYDFLAKLSKTTSSFIDMYFEIPGYTGTEYENNINPKQSNSTLSNISKTFYNCVVASQRTTDKSCRLIRAHWVDARFNYAYLKEEINLNQSNYIFENTLYIIVKLKIIKDNISPFDVFKKFIIKNPIFLDTINKISKFSKNDSLDYWYNEMINNTKIKKSLNRTFLKDKILEFFKLYITGLNNKYFYNLKEVCTNLLYIYESDGFYKPLESNSNIDIKPITKDLLIDKLNNFDHFYMSINTIIMDCYTLCRIFKNFNVSKIDQPQQPHNIIIYAGDYHSTVYRCFMFYLNSQTISITNNITKFDVSPDKILSSIITPSSNCIDISNFKQPFFYNILP